MNKILISAAALAAFGNLTTSAQNAGADSLRAIALKTAEVRATRAGRNAPVAFTDLTKTDLMRRTYGEDIPTALSGLVPSLVVTSDAGNGIGYSDLRLRGSDGTRINVTTNGVPMNDAESHKLYWVDTPDFISSVGSLQVQRGVGTSTNGSGAFGGSINMTTDEIPTRAGGEVSYSYGSFGTNKEAVRLSSGLIGGHWAIDGRFSHLYSKGYMDRAFSNLSSYMVQTAYIDDRTTWKYLLFGGHERTYNAWDGLTADQMQKRRTYNPCGEIKNENDSVVGFYGNQTDNYTQMNHQFIMNHVFNNHWSWNVTGHYTRGNGYYNQWKNNQKLSKYFLTFNDAEGNTIKKSNLTRRKEMTNDFGGVVTSAEYRIKGLDVNLGASANLYTGEHFGSVTSIAKVDSMGTPKEYYRNSARKSDANVFAKATWEAVRGLFLYGDMQYRHVHHEIYGTSSSWSDAIGNYPTLRLNKQYDFFNPKAGVRYTNGDHTVYASAAMANKEPRRDDFINATADAQPKSERLMDYELGYRFGNKYVSAEANLYWMQYHNQLVPTGAVNPDTYDVLYTNVKNSYRRGIELTVHAQPLECLGLNASATWSQNKIKDFVEGIYSYDTWTNEYRNLGNTDIALSPRFLANGSIVFNMIGIEAEFGVQHVGKQYINNSQREELSLKAYTVANLKVGYTLNVKKIIRTVHFGLNVNNLFNKKYVSNAYTYDAGTSKDGGDWYDTRYFPQATRNVLANITIGF